MSAHKRHVYLDPGTKRNSDSQPNSRKKPRFDTVKAWERDTKPMNPEVIQADRRRPFSAPRPPPQRHHQRLLVSDRGRISNGNIEHSRQCLSSGKMTTPFSPNSYPYSGPPENFDVSPGLPDAIPLPDDVTSSWLPEPSAFIKSAAGLDGGRWVGKRPLGSGAFGTAGLWERLDENSVVLEQIVIKESKRASLDRWNGEVPEEVKMMQRMNNTNCKAIPKLIAYKRYMHARKHRIYMEFCPHGDLERLNLNYKRFRTYFPEPFLWHTFNELVKAAAAMQNGPEDASWGYQIVHRDLKPANIFVGFEDQANGFETYPTSKTGDWGLATKIKRNDEKNPIMLRHAGTEEYQAPEQRGPENPRDLEDEIKRHNEGIHNEGRSPLPLLSACTNIWGIGAIMFELLTHEGFFWYKNDIRWAFKEVLKDIPNARKPKYSSALTELIRLCLMPNTGDRPSIEELELNIGARCQSILDEYAVNPGLQHKERLYYRGNEISQMPSGNWNYWHPVIDDGSSPSDPPDPNVMINPSIGHIEYPRFPSSESSSDEEERGEEDDGDSDGSVDENAGKDERGGRTRKGMGGDSIGESDGRGEGGSDERTTRHRSGQADSVSEGHRGSRANVNKRSRGISETNHESSTDSDDSSVKRRTAIKKPPGEAFEFGN